MESTPTGLIDITILSVGVGAFDDPYKNIIEFCADDHLASRKFASQTLWSPVFKDRQFAKQIWTHGPYRC